MAVIEKDRRPPVIGEQLQSARETLALSVADVAQNLDIDADELVLWEQNRGEPTLERLWQLADFYHRGVEYFLVHTDPMPRDLNFRVAKRSAFADMPLDARKVIATFDELCRAAMELDELSSETRKILIQRWKQLVDPETLAQVTRGQMGLDERPVPRLRQLLEAWGVWTFELPVPNTEFSGFSWWHSRYGPCILTNALEPAGRRSFTLGHELAHLLASEPLVTPELASLCDVNLGSNVKEERDANKFAACFLIPPKDVIQEIRARRITPASTDVTEFLKLSRRYGVSLEALIWRLADLSLMTRDRVQELLRQGEPKVFPRRPKTPTWRRRLGERYVSLAFQAHSSGSISLGKLAQFLRLSPYAVQRALQKQAGEAAGSGASQE